MGGANEGSGWIQRVVAPWSYQDGNVLNAIVDPVNLTSWDSEGKKVANFGEGSKESEAVVPTASTETGTETGTETITDTIAKAQATAQAVTTAKKRAASRSRSIYSSPLGIAGEASTAKKTLLGE